MKKLLTSIIIFAGLATAAPAQAPLVTPDATLVDKVIQLCMMDMEQYAKGDKTWIERQVRTMPQAHQKMIVNTCYAWAQGFLAGVKAPDLRTI